MKRTTWKNKVAGASVRVITMALVLCATGFAEETPAVSRERVGQMYEDFRLPKLDGTFGRLSDFRGRKVLLFHFASW